ncbi:baseplate J/gp47 family protein [Tissierella sp.]|uniref:baseplate J/gp47 family protein n=1 Tax=Tissierella sp. TaxID=41274 RepID=UPI002856B4FC|nr:baseplate J/gp47 family protein [Tissierella sp.]MDR7856295.1 baseplate J/gp47 family protein [Tissierella sp.]
MFEDMTYENILTDMLSRATSDVDKREGSIIYDALAPCAYQLAQTYFMLNNFIDLVSGDTAVGEYLDRVVADYGITRKQPTRAIRKIETTGVIDIGTRWGLNDTVYVIRELISPNIYKAECEQYGEIGNIYTGTLENIDNISGITATLTDIFSSGQDEETDENLRSRFYIQIQTPSTSGNVDDYKKWALEVPGVGDIKVFPLWNGNGTVKLLIVDSNMEVDETLEQIVYEHIETLRPICVAVTVDSPTGKDIDVVVNIILDGSKSLVEVKNDFIKSFTDYLKETVFKTYSVSYARIGSLLLSTQGIADYSNLLVNDDTVNIEILDTEMPIAGSVELNEVI